MLLVRHAGPRDAEDVARVHVHAWEVAYRGLLTDHVIRATAGRRLPFWRDYLVRLSPSEHVLVSVEEARVVGFVSARPSPDEDARDDWAEVSALYVDPGAWGRGSGTALLEAIADRLVGDGFATATLWVLTANRRARRFYEHRGWSLDGGVKMDPERGVRELRYRIALPE